MGTTKRPEIKSEWWDDSIVCWSPEYSGRELPNNATTKSVVVGVLRCQETGPIPEFDDDVPSLTGRYQSKYNVCCINQAGRHLQIWQSSTEGGRRIYRYWADFDDDAGHFELRPEGDPTVFFDVGIAPDMERTPPAGVLRVLGPGQVRIEWAEEEAAETYERFSYRATMSDRQLRLLREMGWGKDVPVLAGWLDDEQAPARQADIDDLRASLLGDDFKSLLQALFRLEVDSGNLNRDKVQIAIKGIEKGIGRALSPFREVDRARVASRITPFLVDHEVRLEGPAGRIEQRSMFAWLQRVLHYNANFTLAPNDEANAYIKLWLGVRAAGKYVYNVEGIFKVIGVEESLPFADKLQRMGRHAKVLLRKSTRKIIEEMEKLDWTFARLLPKKKIDDYLGKRLGKYVDKALGLHAGGKLLYGALTIKDGDGAWEATYSVVTVVGAAGAGKAAKLGVEYNDMVVRGYASCDVALNPTSFCGGFDLLSGLLADADQHQLKGIPMVWIIDGGGSGGKIQMVFDYVDTKGSHMDIGWGTGVIDDIESEDVKHFKHAKVHGAPTFDYTTAYKQNDNIFFQLGSATVRPIARQVLRIFAANELALLRDPMSVVAIEGYADRLGPRSYNQPLSESRATNTKQALVDCLGDDLQAKVVTNGYGEDVLEALDIAFDFPDGKPMEQWRRVFVVLDAQVAATLGTNDNKLPERMKGKTRPRKGGK